MASTATSELAGGTAVAARAQPVREIAFIEVRNDAVGRAWRTLKTYVTALRGAAAGVDVTALQQSDRPERFALIASTEGAAALAAAMKGAEPGLQTLHALLVAPIDRREHVDFVPSCPSAADAAAASHGVYVIAHLDIAARDREGADAALRELARAVCAAPGHLVFHLWRQSNRANHFALIAAWTSRRYWAAFSSSAAARQFRETVGPLLGSPYDERLYRVVP